MSVPARLGLTPSVEDIEADEKLVNMKPLQRHLFGMVLAHLIFGPSFNISDFDYRMLLTLYCETSIAKPRIFVGDLQAYDNTVRLNVTLTIPFKTNFNTCKHLQYIV